MQIEELLAIAEWVAWLGAFILATLAYYIAEGVARPLASIPYVGSDISGAIQNYIAEPLKKIASAAEGGLAKGLEQLASALELAAALTILLGAGIYKALGYLWHTALKPFVFAIVNPVRALVAEALTKVEALAETVAGDVLRAESYARGQADRALADARSYADSVARSAEHAAEGYADEAVAKLRSAEASAISEAVAIAHTAEQDATDAFNRAKAAAEALVAPVGADISELDRYITSLDIPALATGAAAVAALVTALLAETGLENAECRGKVKGICGTNPAAWESLLAGIGVIGFGFSLKEIYALVRPLIAEGASVMRQAA